jgi:hypothetical protein
MATGYTKAELDALMHIMNEAVPPVPDGSDKRAARVTAIKAAGTDKGVIFNIETKTGGTEPFWFHCWVSKEIAGAISFASQSYSPSSTVSSFRFAPPWKSPWQLHKAVRSQSGGP